MAMPNTGESLSEPASNPSSSDGSTDRPLSFAEVLRDELAAIDGLRPVRGGQVPTEREVYAAIHARKDRRPAALCLSGGGIRSATFSLGVLQGLARHGLLARFDYLSTVSGGGYIGSWLTAWLHRKQQDGTPDAVGCVVDELAGRSLPPGKAGEVRPEAPAITQLRRFSNYLTPKSGLLSADLWALIATVLRNIILNWFVLIPALLFVLAVPRLVAAVTQPWDRPVALGLYAAGFACCAWTIGHVSRHRVLQVAHRASQGRILLVAVMPVWCAGMLLGVGWGPRFLAASGSDVPVLLFVAFGLAVMLAGWFGYRVSLVLASGPVDPALQTRGAIQEMVVYALTGAVGGALLWTGAMAFDGLAVEKPGWATLVYTTAATPTFILSFTLAATFFVGLASAEMTEEDREWWSRFGGWALISATAWTAVSLTVLLLPQWIANAITFTVAAVATLGTGALTILGGLSQRTLFGANADPSARSGERSTPRLPKVSFATIVSLALPLFMVLFAVFLSLLTDALVQIASHGPTPMATMWHGYLAEGRHVSVARDWHVVWVMAIAAMLGVIAAKFVGVNEFSLHAMYRNRLVRAYLGASRGDHRTPDTFIGLDPDDDVELQATATPGRPRRLFHVVNMALNLVSGDELAWQERKATSMTATSLHVGSHSLGYRPSTIYGGAPRPITLGTAMAISGAAASPNMGYHSSPIVTFLMTLFNARLGWWLGNPGQTGQDSFRRESPKWALQPLFAEAFGWTDEHHPYVYVSDGGHFDNLGLYEMVRRRCQTIVVVDAGADPTCGFEDLSAAIRKIRSDMGIPITLTGGSIVARGASVPAGARAAMVGRIAYSAVDGGDPDTIDGQVVYLKPTFYNRKEPLDVVNYAQGHAAFPHESTSDQFFSESQFESYRALGLHTVELACASLGAPTDSATPHTLDEFVTSVGAYLR